MSEKKFGEWLHIKEYHPSCGQPVLFWHPMYELQRGYYDGREKRFYTANNGNIEEFTNIEWWMIVPESPYCQKVSEYVCEAKL